jgi:hypothetical protein
MKSVSKGIVLTGKRKKYKRKFQQMFLPHLKKKIFSRKEIHRKTE